MLLLMLQCFWFQQSGIPPHFALITHYWFNSRILGKWNSYHGSVEWPLDQQIRLLYTFSCGTTSIPLSMPASMNKRHWKKVFKGNVTKSVDICSMLLLKEQNSQSVYEKHSMGYSLNMYILVQCTIQFTFTQLHRIQQMCSLHVISYQLERCRSLQTAAKCSDTFNLRVPLSHSFLHIYIYIYIYI
jgi:hypothetical protein